MPRILNVLLRTGRKERKKYGMNYHYYYLILIHLTLIAHKFVTVRFPCHQVSLRAGPEIRPPVRSVRLAQGR
jgi:hypothetical protein